MSILIEDLTKTFGESLILDHINLEINTGSLIALLGPSGSGKSTLLKLISGLEYPDSGRIWLTGKDTSFLSIQERQIGFVFQNYALFKHLTVFQNISYGLEVQQTNKKQIMYRVQELLQLIQLENFADRYPSQLSGGQKQRIALARALAIEPKVLLLDEPFGALDFQVRKDLRNWLKKLHEEVSMTTLFVTHDQQEAMELAHEIIILKNGRVEQVGSPHELYDQPLTDFIYKFLSLRH
uniref:Sulfate ABC transporter ATP-binding subunit n=2 Tax=Ostreobium TaxID=121087 RepID=A0A1A8H0J4_9CHLO|nr:Sulfate ABC transporter ATP-binding subunit [Ostreobium quekettii]ANG44386.1 Sulfate/thiosulfate import ATP-binding protein [Ostreobium sp. OS1B]SBQ76998.1 Sulfate ABC transporter ATP-binding subunit [Ostreobium quekettii]